MAPVFEKKITFIIPVYNVAGYIRQCVDSVLSQTYGNIQVILSDDGSSDESGIICDEYAKADSRVTVIHEKNAGLSAARNRGIDRAEGEYIVFLDSDDYWESDDMLEKIIDCLAESDADILVFGYHKLFETTGQMALCSFIGDRSRVLNQPKEVAFRYLTETNIHTGSACRRISRASLIKGKRYFEEGVTSEDLEWTARLVIAAESFDYCPVNGYIYRQREGSITKTQTVKNVLQLQKSIALCIEYGEAIKNTAFYKSYMGYTAYQYITSLANASRLNREDYQKVYDTMVAQSWLLKFGRTRKVRIVSAVKKLAGFDMMMRFLRKYYAGKKNL